MTTFATMVTRIAGELNRSNLNTEIKAAINDAVLEAAKSRLYFNEVKGLSFPTVIGTEYYADQYLTEIDAMYYLVGSSRYEIYPLNNLEVDEITRGTGASGAPLNYSRHAAQIRLDPIPNEVITIYMDGYGRLTPSPLANDADTNAWMTEGERYIRALAKSILLRDKIRDMREAAIYEGIAEDFLQSLTQTTTLRIATGTVEPTRF